VIGPGGVVVIDSKQYRGRLRLDQDGFLWHGRHLLVSTLRRVRWEADQADQVLGVADLTVGAIAAVQGASVPGAAWRPTGSPSPPPAELLTCCGPCRPSLGPSAWPGWPTGPGYASAPLPDLAHLDGHSVPVAVDDWGGGEGWWSSTTHLANASPATPTSIPTRTGRVPLASVAEHNCPVHIPSGGVERPSRVDALRAIDPSACLRSWRTRGPRRLRRRSQPVLVATSVVPEKRRATMRDDAAYRGSHHGRADRR
jgi:hypothetical protein